MKRLLLLPISCFLVLVSCQKKGLPVITQRTEPPVKEVVMPPVSPDTVAGKAIFVTRCGRCHDLPEPGRYNAIRWEGILSSMMPKARLNDEQKVHITAYLKANAGK